VSPQNGLFWFQWLLYFDGVARGYYRGPSVTSTWLNRALSDFKCYFTSPTGGGRSVSIVRVRTKATEFSFSLV